MKIGIVCYPTFGGSGVVATELGMALADNGHEVHFITYNQPVRLDFLSHKLHFHQVLIEEYPLFQYQPYELALSSKMVEVVEKHELEVLHVHYAIPHALCRFYGQTNVVGKRYFYKSSYDFAWNGHYFSWKPSYIQNSC